VRHPQLDRSARPNARASARLPPSNSVLSPRSLGPLLPLMCYFAAASACVQSCSRVEPKYPDKIVDELGSVIDEEARSCELSR
jgi:hypothetical protein